MKKSNTIKAKKQPIAVSLAVTALFLCFASFYNPLTPDIMSQGLLWPLLRLMFFLFIGLAAAQAMEATGWTRALGGLAGPLFRFAHLPPQSSAAFSTAFLSGAAANAMLWEFYQSEKITKKQLILSNLINQLPAFFLHLPTVFFIIVPLAKTAGIIYLALTLVAALLRTFLFLVLGKALFPPSEWAPSPALNTQSNKQPNDQPDSQKATRKSSVWDSIKAKLPLRLVGIAIWVIPVYTGVFVLSSMGGFDVLQKLITRTVAVSFVPVESLSIIILSFAAEFSSGFAAAGALMDAGVLTIRQAVLALLLGNITAFPIRALRHQLPRYIGVFSPKLGTQILLLGQGLRIASLVLVGAVFFILT